MSLASIMTRLFMGEKFNEEDWNDVFDVQVAIFTWFIENIKTEKQILEEKSLLKQSMSSHKGNKRQKD